MLASFRPARSNASVFIDSLSNDIILQAYSNTHLLFGFGSNVESTLTLTNSNLSIAKGAVYSSNIGIGTTTPLTGYRLHVAGSTRIEGDLMVNGDITYLNTDVQVTDQFTVSNAGTGPALVVTQMGAQDIAEFRDDDKVVMRIVDGGYVTIGSNAPATKLDVEGSATIRGTIYTSNVSTSNVQTNSLTSTLSTFATTITSNLYSSNLIINNQVIINSNGVITNSNFLPAFNTSNVVAGQFTSNFIKDDNIISSKLASNLVLKGTTTISSNAYINNGDLRVYGTTNFANVGDQARVYMGDDNYFIGATKNVGIVLQVPGTTYPVVLENATGYLGVGTMDPEENLHVNQNLKVGGSAYVMTKVGVGKSNPTYILDVAGSNSRFANVVVGDMGHGQTWAGFAHSNNVAQDRYALIQSSDGTTYLNTAVGKVLQLRESNQPKLTLSNGLVGIGTATPSNRLHIIGDGGCNIGSIIARFDNIAGSNRLLVVDESNVLPGGIYSGTSNGIGIFSSNDTSTAGLKLYTSSSNVERIRVVPSGLVGIALSNPSYILDVRGSNVRLGSTIIGDVGHGATATSFAHSNMATQYQYALQHTSTGNTLINSALGGYISFRESNDQKMIMSNGYLGIGTATPSNRLDVVGAGTANTGSVIARFANSSGSQRLYVVDETTTSNTPGGIMSDTGYGLGLYSTSAGGAIQLHTSNTERIRITAAGNVGIGTASPSAKLHINGNVYAQSNIQSSVGTLGPTFSLIPECAFADISPGNRLILNQTLEAGNPGSQTTQPLFYGTSYLYQDASGENMAWNYARLMFRGCPLTASASTSVFTVDEFVNTRTPQYSNLINGFTLSNPGSDYGYVSYATPWFSTSTSNARHIALALSNNSANSNFRVGQVLIQFKT